jgi:hypothetical protein
MCRIYRKTQGLSALFQIQGYPGGARIRFYYRRLSCVGRDNILKQKFFATNSRELPQLGAASRIASKIRANSRNTCTATCTQGRCKCSRLRVWCFPLKTVEPYRLEIFAALIEIKSLTP